MVRGADGTTSAVSAEGLLLIVVAQRRHHKFVAVADAAWPELGHAPGYAVRLSPREADQDPCDVDEGSLAWRTPIIVL